MLHLAALASLLLAAAQQNAKPADDGDETVAAQKGNLTPVFELEAIYEALESAEFKLRLDAYQGDLTVLKVAASGEFVKKGDLLFSLDTSTIEKQIAALENDLRVSRAAHENRRDVQLRRQRQGGPPQIIIGRLDIRAWQDDVADC
jgi:multidrug efflux pump subunit AcrA (membrane-fusion protein)